MLMCVRALFFWFWFLAGMGVGGSRGGGNWVEETGI